MKTMTQIGEAIENEAKKARIGFITKYFNRIGVTDHEGVPIKNIEYKQLEDLYIAARCDEGRAYTD